MSDYSLGYGGISSGMNINGMVEQLVAADRKPAETSLNRIEAGAKFKLSALGTVSSAFSSLESALKALKAADAFDARTVKSSVDAVLSAAVGKSTTTSGSTPTGAYSVEVLALASANKWVADAPVAADAKFGAGKLTLTVAGENLSIDIAADSTLADVRSAINTAARSKGVQATVLTSNDGQFLSLSSDKTGAANTLSLSFAEGGSDLQNLVASMKQRTPAQDAKVSIDGLTITASGNTITEAVPGLSLELKTLGTSTVTVAGDPASNRKVVQDFVKAYNAAIEAIGVATQYDAKTKTPSALTGDAQMRGAASQLRNLMGNLLGDLSSQGLDANTLGIQTKGYPASDGTLVFDSAKFDAAMAANPEKIRAAFTGKDGFADKLQTAVSSYLGSDGALTQRTNSLNAQIKDVATRRTALDARMEAVGNRYKRQFVAMETMLSKLSSTSQALAQQLAKLA